MKIIWNEFTDTWVFGIICGLILGAIVFYPLGIYNGKRNPLRVIQERKNIQTCKHGAMIGL